MCGWPGSPLEPAASLNTSFKPSARLTAPDRRPAIPAAGSNAYWFHVPYLDRPVKCQPDLPPPLVVITTNEERELPAAFVRRCLVLQLALPKDDALIAFLVKRGKAHFSDKLAEKTYHAAAKLVADDRAGLIAQGLVAPGQAEYLDLLRAVLDVAGQDANAQAKALDDVKGFVLDKNPPGGR